VTIERITTQNCGSIQFTTTSIAATSATPSSATGRTIRG
jgi:hypothetical protein